MKRTSKRWTEEELKLLRNNRIPEGRTVYGARNKRTRMGLREKKKYRVRWSDSNIELLKSCRQKSKILKEICEHFPSHSRNAIQKKLCAMGLAKRNKIFKFPIEVQERFKSFLRSNWKGKTPQDLMILWNAENNKFKTNKKRVVNYLTKMKIKISYGEVQKINNLRKKEQKVISLEIAKPADRLEKFRIERVKLMRNRMENNHDIWTGIDLEVNSLECG